MFRFSHQVILSSAAFGTYLNFPLILRPASTFIFKYITHITITSVKLKNMEMISRENSKLQPSINFEGSDDLVIIPLMVLNVDP